MFRSSNANRRALLGVMLASAAAGLVGCGNVGPDPAAEAVAKEAYQHLSKGEDDALEAMLLPAARGAADKQTFAMMRGLIPKGEPVSATQVNWQSFVGTGGHTLTYQHAYDYGSQVVTATTVLLSVAGKWRLQSFNVNTQITKPTPAPAQAEKAPG